MSKDIGRMGNNNGFKRKVGFWAALALLMVFSGPVIAKEERCPGENNPPPAVLKADVVRVKSVLESLKDSQGRLFWKSTSESDQALRDVFDSVPQKTKLEQFYQLLFLLQKNIDPQLLPVTVNPPGITNLLLSARVFTNPSFPKKITSVILRPGKGEVPPTWKVEFADKEVRFPINEGQGFASWDQGMCQIAKELVFYPGFSFVVRKARNSQNLVVDRFDGVEIFGQFGTRQFVSIDLSYVDLEKVEFIKGTDQGKVKARVAKREFETNEHSALFKFVGSMIPNTSQQRIDW